MPDVDRFNAVPDGNVAELHYMQPMHVSMEKT
jgi:hypothetical protein